MDFRVPRSAMLGLVADALKVPEERRSAFLGRFQHLQRLKLVEGINPGRGSAASYRAHQIVVIALAFQMIQLGLTPERAVEIMKANQDRVRLSIGYAAKNVASPMFLWFDAALLSNSDEMDWAEATFDYGGQAVVTERFADMFFEGEVQRMAFISVTNTMIDLAANARPAGPFGDEAGQVLLQSMFVRSILDWFKQSTPDSFA